jgi:hypothetical protein
MMAPMRHTAQLTHNSVADLDAKAKLASFHPTLNLLGWMPAVYVPASVVKGLMDSERDREYPESPDGSCRTKVCQEQKTVYFQKIQHFTPFF